jgi:hypothetical protein
MMDYHNRAGGRKGMFRGVFLWKGELGERKSLSSQSGVFSVAAKGGRHITVPNGPPTPTDLHPLRLADGFLRHVQADSVNLSRLQGRDRTRNQNG